MEVKDIPPPSVPPFKRPSKTEALFLAQRGKWGGRQSRSTANTLSRFLGNISAAADVVRDDFTEVLSRRRCATRSCFGGWNITCEERTASELFLTATQIDVALCRCRGGGTNERRRGRKAGKKRETDAPILNRNGAREYMIEECRTLLHDVLKWK